MLLLHQGGDNEYNVYNGLGLLRHDQPGMWSVAWPWSAGELPVNLFVGNPSLVAQYSATYRHCQVCCVYPSTSVVTRQRSTQVAGYISTNIYNIYMSGYPELCRTVNSGQSSDE